MDKKIVSVLCLLVLLVVSGCARRHPAIVQVQQGEVDIANASVAVAKSLDKLATTEQRGNPIRIQRYSPEPLDYGMGGLVSLDWTGPLGNLVKKIGEISGYRVKVIGEEPGIPIIVSFAEENVPMGDLLRQAGLQAKTRAEISVYTTAKLIELHYVG